jgi:hypothetical protein
MKLGNTRESACLGRHAASRTPAEVGVRVVMVPLAGFHSFGRDEQTLAGPTPRCAWYRTEAMRNQCLPSSGRQP